MKIFIFLLSLTISLYSFEYTLKEGWNLLGSTEEIENMSQLDADCVVKIYRYDEGKWLECSKERSDFNTLGGGEGFWIYTNSSCTIDTTTLQSSTPDTTTTEIAAYTPLYKVASAPLLENLSAATIDTSLYDSGYLESGRRYYIADIMDKSAGIFNVSVPNESIYGDFAGEEMEYAYTYFYPTTDENSNADGTFLGVTIPKMESVDGTPQVATAKSKYPLIVISHGKGGSALSYFDYAQNLASLGYIVALLWHGDNSFEEYGSATTSPHQFALRPLALTSLIEFMLDTSPIKAYIDSDNIGAVGTSWGGSTIVALLGGEIIDVANPLETIKLATNDKIDAAFGIVPYFGDSSIEFFGINAAGLQGKISRPFMAIAAADDSVATFDRTKTSLQTFEAQKYLIKLSNEGHDLSTASQDDVLAWMHHFFDAHLNGSEGAQSSISNPATTAKDGVIDSIISL